MSAQQRTVSDLDLDMIVRAEVRECMRTLIENDLAPITPPVPRTATTQTQTQHQHRTQFPDLKASMSTDMNALMRRTITPSNPLGSQPHPQPQPQSYAWMHEGGRYVPGAHFRYGSVSGSLSGSMSGNPGLSDNGSTSASVGRSARTGVNAPQTNRAAAVGQHEYHSPVSTPMSAPMQYRPQAYTAQARQYTSGVVPGSGHRHGSESGSGSGYGQIHTREPGSESASRSGPGSVSRSGGLGQSQSRRWRRGDDVRDGEMGWDDHRWR